MIVYTSPESYRPLVEVLSHFRHGQSQASATLVASRRGWVYPHASSGYHERSQLLALWGLQQLLISVVGGETEERLGGEEKSQKRSKIRGFQAVFPFSNHVFSKTVLGSFFQQDIRAPVFFGSCGERTQGVEAHPLGLLAGHLVLVPLGFLGRAWLFRFFWEPTRWV